MLPLVDVVYQFVQLHCSQRTRYARFLADYTLFRRLGIRKFSQLRYSQCTRYVKFSNYAAPSGPGMPNYLWNDPLP